MFKTENQCETLQVLDASDGKRHTGKREMKTLEMIQGPRTERGTLSLRILKRTASLMNLKRTLSLCALKRTLKRTFTEKPKVDYH